VKLTNVPSELPSPYVLVTWLNVTSGGGLAWVAVTVADVSGAQATSQKSQPNGYPTLDASGKIPLSQLPAITPTINNGSITQQMLAYGVMQGKRIEAGRVGPFSIDPFSSVDTTIGFQSGFGGEPSVFTQSYVLMSSVWTGGTVVKSVSASNFVMRLSHGANSNPGDCYAYWMAIGP